MHRLFIAFSVAALMAGFSTQAEAQQNSRAPDGLFVSGGFHTYAGWGGGYPGMRVDLGIPLGDLPIKIILPMTLDGRANHLLFTLIPGIQYEYRLEQIDMKGLLAIYGEGGVGIFVNRWRYRDVFFDERQTRLGGAFRVGLGVRYYMENPEGLFFFANPIGFTAFVRDGGGASYEASLGAGWVF
jgi:hypothetical protein